MDKVRSRSDAVALWFRWALATTIGLFIGGTVGTILGAVAGVNCRDCGFLEDGILAGFVEVPGRLIVGVTLAAGLQHWLVLRRLMGHSIWWPVVSGITTLPGIWLNFRSLPLDFLNFMVTPPFQGDTVSSYNARQFIPPLVVLGVAVGVSQWLLLRSRLPRAGWWIPGMVVALAPFSWPELLGMSSNAIDIMWSFKHFGIGPDLWLVMLRLLGESMASGVWAGATSGATLVWLTTRRSLPADTV